MILRRHILRPKSSLGSLFEFQPLIRPEPHVAQVAGFDHKFVAQSLDSDYMLSLAHAIAGRQAVSPKEFEAARTAKSSDLKIAQALSFAKRMVEVQGKVERSEVAAVQQVGYTDEEIVEIIAAIALNVFRNCFNLAVHTDVDFPRVRTSQSESEEIAGK